MELKAYQAYRAPDLDIRFWRTANGQEVDLILGDMQVTLEIKGSARVHDGDLHGLRTLAEESRVRRSLVICLEREPRVVPPAIEVLPWRHFLDQLWAGEMGV
jgi:predicted AAA+ superfamily ATPase